MTIDILQTSSANNFVNKNVTSIKSGVSCNVKEPIRIINPVVILSFDVETLKANYAYIPDYKRYYYITDIVPLTGGRIELHLAVDVLYSFKDDILNSTAIIDKQQNIDNANVYLNDGSYVTQEKEFHSVINYPNGFLEDGEYILITCGGAGTI